MATDSIHAALKRGHCVAVFPEGTTSDGRSVLGFHSGLLDPAVTSQSLVWPAALRYRTFEGKPTDCAAFIGTQSLLASMSRVMTQPPLLIELHFAAPLEGARHDRRSLSDQSRASLVSMLGFVAREPETDSPSGLTACEWSGEPAAAT